jgi:hypothetical protein
VSAAKDTLILSLRLKSGDFNSELHVTFPTTPDEQKRAVERWLDFMATGLRLSAESLDATFSPTLPRNDGEGG